LVAGSASFLLAVLPEMNAFRLREPSMRAIVRSFFCFSLLLAGYVIGSLQADHPSFLHADQQTEPLPTAIRDRLRDTDRNLGETMQMLQEDKRYVPAIQGLNAFATTVGGVDAIADLESGQGVDPETFAGLYAGQALAEVTENLARDAEGHLTYKNKIVRVYSSTRMRQLFATRAEFVPAGAPSSKRPAAASKKETEPAPEKAEDK
jgi:hypothetical protein